MCYIQNVEHYCDAVLNIVLEVVPEDYVCVETRWTLIRIFQV
jgi:hypothetical protein